jgi:6-phosphogluconolactonase
MTTLTTHHFPSRAALDGALAERLAGALAEPGRSGVMLSGGTTPMPAYRALARRTLPHDEQLHVLFSDDRYVPSDSDASNYHQSRALLEALALKSGCLLRVRTELALEEAAADYERQLAALLGSGAAVGLGLLGLGVEGHTASLFSLADLERSRGRLAIAVHRPDGMSAVSVTPEFLGHVRAPLFVVAGTGKEAAVRDLVAGDPMQPAWRAVQGCPAAELWIYEGN